MAFVTSASVAAESGKGLKSFFEGYELYQKGFYEDAIPFLEDSIKNAPTHYPAYARLADCYERLGRYSKAAPVWQKYLEIRPSQKERIGKHVELLSAFAKAEKSLTALQDSELADDANDKLWTEATPLLKKVAEDQYPGSAIAEKAIMILMPRLLDTENYADALAMVKKLMREFPESVTPQVKFWWGVSLRGNGQYLDAIPVLELAEKLYHNDPPEQKKCRRELALCYMGIAQGLMQTGRNLPAREALKILRNKYMSSLSPEEMLKAQNFMILCEGKQVAQWIAAGDKYASQGMYEDALRWYKKVRTLSFSNIYTIQAEDRIKRLEGLGNQKLAEMDELIKNKQYNAAMKLAESVEKSFDQDFRIKAMNKYADAAEGGKQWDLAAKKLFELAQRYPNLEDGAIAYARVGYMYGIKAKDPNKGLAVFQAMTQWNPTFKPARRESQLGMGILLTLLGRKEEATKILTAVAIEYKGDQRIKDMCREYIWKCKNCSEISL